MSKTKTLIAILFLISGFASAQRSPEISAKELKADIYYLASDSLKGRKPGTPEGDLAAKYIREQFRVSGLKLIGDNGFQYFDIVTSATLGEKNELRFEGFTGTLKKDFTPVAFSSNATIDAGVVFAGYGFDIDQDSLKWKDYDGVDVKGKWVVIFRGDPELDNSDSKFIPYSEIRSKILTAKDHGVAGVLLVTPVALDKDDKLMPLHSENNEVTAGLPVINIKKEVANMLLKSSRLTLDSLERTLNRSRKPKSFALPFKVNATTEVVLNKA